MDDHSGCFPGFSITREIVIQSSEEASGADWVLFCCSVQILFYFFLDPGCDEEVGNTAALAVLCVKTE